MKTVLVFWVLLAVVVAGCASEDLEGLSSEDLEEMSAEDLEELYWDVLAAKDECDFEVGRLEKRAEVIRDNYGQGEEAGKAAVEAVDKESECRRLKRRLDEVFDAYSTAEAPTPSP